ncbi:MAG: hypothetical protein AB8H80_07115 [Planctomycetota bacterium]
MLGSLYMLAHAGRRRIGAALLLCLAVVLAAQRASTQAKVHPDELALQPKIEAAIAEGVEYLLSEQHRDGSWGMHGNFIGGRAALCVYALLQSGVPRTHPSIRRAMAYLDSVEPEHTYATTCMILAYDAMLGGGGDAGDGGEERIASFVDKLLSWQRPAGDWAYPVSASDLSCTQYAALGLYIAQKRRMKIDPRVFKSLARGLKRYRGKVVQIDNPDQNRRTGAAKVDMAGYVYRPQKDIKETGSMTTAAIAVMQICRAGLGRKLPRELARDFDDRQQQALRWLEVHFSVTENPNHGRGNHLYYLYGLERIGSLLQTELVGPHRWYVEGARHLVGSQRDGAWGGVNDTCFALLFLRRATGRAPTTGGGATAMAARHAFSVGGDDADVRLRAAGQQPLSIWLDGFGEQLKLDHEDFGLRVVSVEYVNQDGAVLGRIAGDASRVWHNATFLYREKAMARGEHRVKARITLLSPECAPGATEPVEVLESEWMTVRIRDVFEPWMESSAQLVAANLLRTMPVEVQASSERKRHAPTHLFDGTDTLAWIAAEDDETPGFSLSWEKSTRVASILFTHPAPMASRLGEYDAFDGIEVRLGKDRDRWLQLPFGKDRMQPVRVDLPKPRRLRSIEVRFYGRERATGRIGLAEFVLLAPEKSRRKTSRRRR